tara:strand:+ start:457 stop:1380 length:924 start_codon:yes stop_codon:yes gene_type:complete
LNPFHKDLAELNLDKLQSVSSEMTLADLVTEFNSKNFGAFGVTDESGALVGIVSERDLLLRTKPSDFSRWGEIKISTIMSKKIFSLDFDKSIADAIQMMSRMEFRHLPIKKDNEYLILSARTLLDLVISNYQEICDKFGTLKDWDTHTGHIHEENHLFLGKSDTLDTGTFLFAPIKEVGGSDLLKVDAELSIAQLWQTMSDAHLPVAAISAWGTLLKGVVTERDFITKVFPKGESELSKPTKSLMTEKPHHMMLKHHIVYALNNMGKYRYRNVLIVDEDKFPVLNAELIHFLKFFSKIIEANASANA